MPRTALPTHADTVYAFEQIQHLPLRILILERNNYISTECVNKLSHLEIISVQGLSHVNDACLKALAQRCPCLIDLRVYDCNQVTHAFVKGLVLSCPHLQTLRHWRRYTDQVTSGVHTELRQLTRLIQQKCPRIVVVEVNGVELIVDGKIVFAIAVAKFEQS